MLRATHLKGVHKGFCVAFHFRVGFRLKLAVCVFVCDCCSVGPDRPVCQSVRCVRERAQCI